MRTEWQTTFVSQYRGTRLNSRWFQTSSNMPCTSAHSAARRPPPVGRGPETPAAAGSGIRPAKAPPSPARGHRPAQHRAGGG
jgi:hypothetical protein